MREITLKAVVENLPALTAFIDRELEAHACGARARAQIDVAIDEIFSNIAHYAYARETGAATVRFEFDEATRVVTISVSDAGAPFNPLEQAEPDVKAGLEARAIGGLGIFLVRKTMDAVEYRRADGRNLLTLRKKI